MEELIIESISEAFSMQPRTLFVYDKTSFKSPNENSIEQIKLEFIKIEGDPFEFYVGYDFKGKKKFEYRKGTVNVHYF